MSEAKAVWILDKVAAILSVCHVRMDHLGEGANECAARRRVAMAEVERMRKEGEGKMVWLLRINPPSNPQPNRCGSRQSSWITNISNTASIFHIH